jgi:hypothetical protein
MIAMRPNCRMNERKLILKEKLKNIFIVLCNYLYFKRKYHQNAFYCFLPVVTVEVCIRNKQAKPME